jgi:hypothetical protein
VQLLNSCRAVGGWWYSVKERILVLSCPVGHVHTCCRVRNINTGSIRAAPKALDSFVLESTRHRTIMVGVQHLPDFGPALL